MDDVRKLVRVKPLFWDAPDKTAWLGSGVSPCEYYIRFENGSWWMPGDDEESAEAFLSDEAAKAAAQADYEARILAALTPAPSLAAAKAEGMREAAALCRKRAISLYKTARNGEAMNTSAMMRAAEKYEQAAEVILAAADAPATEDDEAHPESRDYIRGWNDCMMKTHKLVPVNPPAPAQEDAP